MPTAPPETTKDQDVELQSQQRPPAAPRARGLGRPAAGAPPAPPLQTDELPQSVQRTVRDPATGPAPSDAKIPPPRHNVMLEEVEGYEEVETAPARVILPVFDAIVVYVGSNRKKSVSLRGHMHVEQLENMDGQRTERLVPVSGEGIQVYDFTSHGTDGRPLRDKLLPVNARDPLLANKVAMKVNHPDHLLYFHNHRETENGPPVFKVLVAPLHRQAWQDFLLRAQDFQPLEGADVAMVERVLKDDGPGTRSVHVRG